MRSQGLYPPLVQSASHPGIQTRDTLERSVRGVRGVVPAKDINPKYCPSLYVLTEHNKTSMKNDNHEQRRPDSLIYKRFM